MSVSKKSTAIILVIISLIVVFSIVGSTSDNITDSATTISEPNNCTDGTDAVGETLTYDTATNFCVNSTSGQLYSAERYDLPLASLFSPSGVALLVFMAGVLFFVIATIRMKKQ